MSCWRRGLLMSLILPTAAIVHGGQEAHTQALFEDLQFRRGFMLSHPDSSKGRSVEAVLHFGDANNVPAWRLCQWATKFSLAGTPCVRGSDGDWSCVNEGKRVVVGETNSPDRDLILDVRGSAEYGAEARRSGQGWPHLLVEQDAAVTYRLDELTEIRLTLSLRLLHCTSHMPADEYNPGLHAAQFQLFFIIRNVNPDSQDRGGYYWFGVPFFDSRHDVPPAYMARDAGKDDATGKFIYTIDIDGRTVGVTPLKTGRWLALDADVLPFIRSGLQEAVKRGYLRDGDPHDYAVVNMNLGWEIPGTFDAAMQVRDLDISARRHSSPATPAGR